MKSLLWVLNFGWLKLCFCFLFFIFILTLFNGQRSILQCYQSDNGSKFYKYRVYPSKVTLYKLKIFGETIRPNSYKVSHHSLSPTGLYHLFYRWSPVTSKYFNGVSKSILDKTLKNSQIYTKCQMILH